MISMRPLPEDRIPLRLATDTARGDGLVRRLATADLTHGDLLRCAATVAERVYLDRLEPTELQRINEGLKAQKHEAEQRATALAAELAATKEELAAYKAALGSETKINTELTDRGGSVK